MKKKLLCIVTTVTLLFSQNTNFAQVAPQLGTTAEFVLFTSIGAIENTNIPVRSHLTGNVGTHSGAITGFGNVNGEMHITDGESAQAASDLTIAYYQIDTATPKNFHAVLIGNGETFIPGVHSMPANTTLSNTLNLDAAGNPNAVFIIQIEGTFGTTTAAEVVLLNGAKACNVFWKVEGLVSLAVGTIMKGTIIVNNAAINMATGVTLEGRALSTVGAITTDGFTAYTPTGCGSPVLTGPSAAALGSTVCFAIFSSNGSVINGAGGVTNVTGDIGTNLGITSGYDHLKVNGTIHPGPDVTTNDCATDLLAVYNYLHTLPNDIELMFPADFGHNLVLTPHTYVMNGATSLTDTLYLNAEGNANAVFVIKVFGAFATTTGSKVILTNGALAKNVFWKVEGAVHINNNSIFNGTIVNRGAIMLGLGSDINGRAMTINGEVSTNGIDAIITEGCSSVLPLSWLYFRGKAAQNDVLLEWSTTNDKTNSFFTVEKSSDGQRFDIVTTVKSSETQNAGYNFTDKQPYNVTYYRISQTDKDGQKTYYRTIQVKMSVKDGKTFHYIQGDYIFVQTSGLPQGNGSIELYSIDGKKMSIQKVMLTNESSTYKIQKPAQRGMYLINIIGNGEKFYNGKVMVL